MAGRQRRRHPAEERTRKAVKVEAKPASLARGVALKQTTNPQPNRRQASSHAVSDRRKAASSVCEAADALEQPSLDGADQAAYRRALARGRVGQSTSQAAASVETTGGAGSAGTKGAKGAKGAPGVNAKTAGQNAAVSPKPNSTRTRRHASFSPFGPVIVDVEGHSLTDAERERLQHPLVGGVILFARNYESPRQLRALTDEIHACRSPSLLITADQEGGRVQRFRQGFTPIPAMRTLGELWDQDVLAACREATRVGEMIGRELREAGVDLSFTPVLDIDHGHSSVIGNRAFHSDPRVVAMLARCLSHGLLLAGMANCAKHFPGHGFADADSHVAMPVDERCLKTILADDAAPYAWLGQTITAVMPAHVIYPKVDAKPAGFSRRWLKTVLRKQLGFDGLIFSDDLTMEAASVAGDITARATAALKAGCDMVLVCNRPDLADQLLATLKPPANPDLQRRLAALRPRQVV